MTTKKSWLAERRAEDRAQCAGEVHRIVCEVMDRGTANYEVQLQNAREIGLPMRNHDGKYFSVGFLRRYIGQTYLDRLLDVKDQRLLIKRTLRELVANGVAATAIGYEDGRETRQWYLTRTERNGR